MRMTTLVAAALATATLTATAATATAEPDRPAATPQTGVNYAVTATDTAATITTDAGSLVTENGVFEIKAANGQVLAGIPLSFQFNGVEYPIQATIDGRTATLAPVALPYQNEAPWRSRYDREQAAFQRASLQIGAAAAGGAAVGTAIGGVIGCVGGAVVGTVVTGILAALFGAGPLAGCLAGIAIGAGVGAFAGALLITAPIAVASLIQYFTTVNEPFTPAAPAAK
ncbi:hypothetical protein KO481_37990 [Nocardia sp. NEAU-G5]|uniref:DUF8020 domain-containing protein n=1 Tax=Nocardia albiluteola TaxID=2842303 RepID=A0ABS6BD06_9NOCA|nr:hypothetical protein [Nocardia albiluteola]MBU3067300.1 hypothetical protein [Nocardia albiluteola]